MEFKAHRMKNTTLSSPGYIEVFLRQLELTIFGLCKQSSDFERKGS